MLRFWSLEREAVEATFEIESRALVFGGGLLEGSEATR